MEESLQLKKEEGKIFPPKTETHPCLQSTYERCHFCFAEKTKFKRIDCLIFGYDSQTYYYCDNCEHKVDDIVKEINKRCSKIIKSKFDIMKVKKILKLKKTLKGKKSGFKMKKAFVKINNKLEVFDIFGHYYNFNKNTLIIKCTKEMGHKTLFIDTDLKEFNKLNKIF